MFSRLITKMAINPSFFNDFAFYSKRLKKEQSVRRLGFVFIVLAMFVQIIAGMFPAERSLAASSNDIIYGGVTSKTDLVNKCNNNAQVKAVYAKFGVTCADINATTTKLTTINSSGNYWSVGRTPLSNHGISSQDWGERSFNAGGQSVYHRPLKAWGSGVNYEAFSVKSGNKTYWIIKNCGNITTTGPEGPAPNLEVSKKLLTRSVVKPGDEVKFLITYRNTVSESVAEGFRLRDLLDKNNLSFVSLVDANGKNVATGNIEGDPIRESKGFPYSPTSAAVTLTVKVKPSVASGTKICNTARVSTVTLGPTGNKDSNKVCVDVFIPNIPPPPPPPKPDPKPEEKCPYDKYLKASDPKCIEDPKGICVVSTALQRGSNKDIVVITQSSVEGNTKVQSYKYDIDADGKIDSESISQLLTDKQEFKNLSQGTHKIKVYVEFKNGSKTTTKNCEAEIDIAEDPKLVQSKSVSDSNGKDLDGEKVSSGDELVFKLTTKNITSSDYNSFSGEDYFGDVLEYAEITNMEELEKQGVSLSKDNYLRWSVAKISGNSEDVKVIKTKVKKVLSSTNTPESSGTDQDCVISNKYGNQVSMSVNCPLIKKIETTTTKLPDTGPGSAIAFAFIIASLAGYFYSRSRLLNKEAKIIKDMYRQAV